MKVRHFRRQFQGTWRQFSRLAVTIVCVEMLWLACVANAAWG